MTYVLGIDPGVISGYALLGLDGIPLVWGQTGAAKRRGTGDDAMMAIANCADTIGAPASQITLAIEGQFILQGGGKGGDKWGSSLATLKTARHAGIWIGVAQSLGMPVFEHNGEPSIQPQTWRGRVWGGRWSTDEAKAEAIRRAETAWGIVVQAGRHHTAEAMWIAKYVQTVTAAQRRQPELGL